MLDDDQASAVFDQALKGGQQLGDVVEVQARGGLVEDEERALAIGHGQVRRQLHALRLAAGERGGRLAQAQIAQAHVVQHLQLVHQARGGAENVHGFAHGELQRLVDIESVVANLEDAALVARALALFAHQLDVGQELHLDGHRAIALADLAAAAGDVEGEVAGGISALLGLARGGEQGADCVERLDVGHRVGARRAPDGRLIDHDGARRSARRPRPSGTAPAKRRRDLLRHRSPARIGALASGRARRARASIFPIPRRP